jgi:hypothetical protein
VQPVSAIFSPLQCSLPVAVVQLEDVVRQQGMTYKGSYWINKHTAGGLKGIGFVRGTLGSPPSILGLEDMDGLSLPIQVKADDQIEEFVATLIVEPESVVLRLVFESSSFLSSEGSPWLVGLMSQVLSTFILDVGILDFSDRLVGENFVTPDGLARRIRDFADQRPRFPLIAVTKDPVSRELSVFLSEAVHGKTLRVTSGHVAFFWGLEDVLRKG